MRPTLIPSRLTLACALLLSTPALSQAQARFLNPPALPTPRGYSQVADVGPNSRLVILSGQVPLDSTGQLVGGADFERQATQVFRNINLGLAAAGASFKDVVKISYYLLDAPNHIAALRKVRDQYIDAAAPPTSTLLQVSGFFRPDILLEIEVIAVVPATGR